MRAIWPFVAGMAWAMLPCGLLYAAVMVAALAPDALGGGLVMLAFAVPGAFGVWGAPMVLRRLARLGRRADVTASSELGQGDAAAIVPVLWLRSARPDGCAGGANRRELAPTSPDAGQAGVAFDPRWAVRLSGLMLAAMSAWALYHQVMDQWRAWCA